MTDTKDHQLREDAVTKADKSRIRASLIERNLADVQEALAKGELSEDEKTILDRVNTRLLNIQRTVNELKKNVTDGTTSTQE